MTVIATVTVHEKVMTSDGIRYTQQTFAVWQRGKTMKLNHEGEYICECENWEEPVLYPVAELIRCKDCKAYLPETETLASYCPILNILGLPEDAYCYKAQRKDNDQS